MTKYILKPLTENSWIISTDGNKLGIITQTKTEIKVIGKLPKSTYKNLDDLKQQLGGQFIEDTVTSTEEPEEGEINGYPIKHQIWHNILTDPVSSYTRTKTSVTRYAAGYYAFKFANGWSQSFCPKLTTLIENEYIGPYTTKLELRNAISQKNQSKVI